MARYFKVKNLEKFQAYKDNRPVHWIKLHLSIFEDYEFSCLDDHEKFQLIMIWGLAAKMNNRIPNDENWVQKQIGSNSKVNLQKLVEYNFLNLTDDSEIPNEAVGEVYLFHAPKSHRVKIGFTSRLGERLNEVRRKEKEEIIFVTSIIGDRKKEGQLHQLFKDFFIESEWFHDDPFIFDHFEQITVESPLYGDNNRLYGDNNRLYGDNESSVPRVEKSRVEKSRVEKTPPTPPQGGAVRCPTKEILDLYHANCKSLKPIQELTGARSAAIRARWKDHPDLAFWQGFYQHVEKSNFLSGRAPPRPGSDRPFLASWDWIHKHGNFMKICGGNYDNRGAEKVEIRGSNQTLDALAEWRRRKGLGDSKAADTANFSVEIRHGDEDPGDSISKIDSVSGED